MKTWKLIGGRGEMAKKKEPTEISEEDRAISEEEKAISQRLRLLMGEGAGAREQFKKVSGYSESALKLVLGGKSMKQFVKLADLARSLNTTPNVILGFDEMPASTDLPHDELQELLEQLLSASLQGVDVSKIGELARRVIALLAEPPLDEADLGRRESRRAQVAILLRQYRKPRDP